MANQFEIEINCPFCLKDIEIIVDYDSPSDYYFDDSCPECNRKIESYVHWRSLKTIDLAVQVMEEVSEQIVCAAEYRRELINDR
jgi:hypothetical protein